MVGGDYGWVCIPGGKNSRATLEAGCHGVLSVTLHGPSIWEVRSQQNGTVVSNYPRETHTGEQEMLLHGEDLRQATKM